MAIGMVRAYGLMEGSAEVSVVQAPGGDVIARAQRGEEAALESLYREHSPRVYSLCLRMLGDEGEAQRLTQEVFRQAFRKIRAFRGEMSLPTWLCGITVSLVLTKLKTCSSEQGGFDEIRPLGKLGSGSYQVESLTRSSRLPIGRTKLESAIRDLPVGHRIVFLLHDVFGYSHDQVAGFLGCSPGNSKSRLHQARLQLRALLCGMGRADPLIEETMLKPEEQTG